MSTLLALLVHAMFLRCNKVELAKRGHIKVADCIAMFKGTIGDAEICTRQIDADANFTFSMTTRYP
eukprot:scaffold21923_cov77-Skeletonema_dohrnii-CCMP3373.AAC.2